MTFGTQGSQVQILPLRPLYQYLSNFIALYRNELRNEMTPVAVEDHLLWAKWKARLEELLAAKAALDAAEGASSGTARQVVARYNAALYAYNKISEEI